MNETCYGRKRRLKRFTRERKAVPRIIIQARDFDILESLAEYRFLNTLQIIALHRGGERNLKRRLQKLFHHGFIDRPPHQLSYHQPIGHMIYALGNKGSQLLVERGNLEKGKIDWTTKNREVKERYIKHALMISNFRAVLTLALKDEHDARLVRWQQGIELKDYVKLYGRKVPIVPDAFFTLETVTPHRHMHFFLEADQSTMTRARFLKKMRTYWAWRKIKGHVRKFRIDSYRVLTLCKSELRKENLRQITKKADDRKTGAMMFWFYSEKDIDLSNPQRILGSVWQTPKDDTWHYLLE